MNDRLGLVRAAVSGWLGTALEFMDFSVIFTRRGSGLP